MSTKKKCSPKQFFRQTRNKSKLKSCFNICKPSATKHFYSKAIVAKAENLLMGVKVCMCVYVFVGGDPKRTTMNINTLCFVSNTLSQFTLLLIFLRIWDPKQTLMIQRENVAGGQE